MKFNFPLEIRINELNIRIIVKKTFFIPISQIRYYFSTRVEF